MKSIEELIDDIIELAEEGVLYTPDYFKDKYKMDEQLNQSKDNKAEILRRFEELEKAEERQRFKKEYYHEEHAKELIKRVELEKENERLKNDGWVKRVYQLEHQLEDMKCCGNCQLRPDVFTYNIVCVGCNNNSNWKERET